MRKDQQREHNGAASATAGGSREMTGAVRFEECHHTSGLWFRSFLPGPAAPHPWARLALLHGYGDHGGRYGHVLNWLASRGISCATLDFRGHGRSSGRRGYVRHWGEFLDNLDCFQAWERSQYEHRLGDNPSGQGSASAPLFVLGHSHGGLVTAAAGIAGRLESVSGCILSSPYLQARTPLSGFWSAFGRLANRIAPWIQVKSGLSAKMMSSDPAMQGDAERDPLLVHGATPRWYFETLRTQRQTQHDAAKFRLPLLCLVGDADSIADPDVAEQFVQAAGAADKTFIRYPAKLHELLRETGREMIVQTIFDWIRAKSGGANRIPG
jgi:alpha-beta hydrolase superfamily lysophospholipase